MTLPNFHIPFPSFGVGTATYLTVVRSRQSVFWLHRSEMEGNFAPGWTIPSVSPILDVNDSDDEVRADDI